MARERATVILETQEGGQTLNLPLPAAKAVVRDALAGLGKATSSITVAVTQNAEGKAAE